MEKYRKKDVERNMLDILIVEDNEEIGTLLCDFLRKENYTVSVACTGEKAMELYEKYGARVIVLDIMLPGMDGFAVCSKIREKQEMLPAREKMRVSKDKKGRLIDFGASKKADFSGVDISALVKDGYSPPELYRINSHPTKEADVYSLAATIYFICEKKNLPLSTNPKKVALALDQINDDRFGEDFLVILDRALSDKPSARQHSVKEFAEDLKRVLKL